MQSRNTAENEISFAVEFMQDYLKNSPPIGEYVTLPTGYVRPTIVTSYMEQYFHPDAKCTGVGCASCTAYARVIAVDRALRKSVINQALSYKDVMDYLNALYAQNQFIFENLSSLRAECPYLGDFKLHFEFAKNITLTLLEKHIEYIRALTRCTNRDEFTELEFAAFSKNIEGIHVEINKLVFRFESLFDKYKDKANAYITPMWFFMLYKYQLEGIVSYVQSVPNLNRKHQGALGWPTLLSKLQDFKNKINNQLIDVFYLALEARVAFHLQGKYAAAFTVIEKAEMLCSKLLDEGEISQVEADDAKMSLGVIHLSFLTMRMRNNPINKVEEINKAYHFAMSFSELIAASSATLKGNLQMPLIFLFDSLITHAHEKFLFLRKVADLQYLKECAKKLNDIILLYGKTSSPAQRQEMVEDLKKLTGHFVRFCMCLQEKEDMFNKQDAENVEKLKKLNEEIEKYNAEFPKVLAKFRQAQRKLHPPKPVHMPDAVLSKEKPAASGSVETVAPAPRQLTISEQCVQFFQNHGLRECEKLIAQVDNNNKPEVMLYTGDHYMRCHNYVKALTWYEEAIKTSQKLPNVNADLKRGMTLSLSLCERDLQAELDYAQAEYDRSIASRKVFIRQLAEQVLSDEEIDTLTQKEVMEIGQAEFARLGKKNQAEGKPLSAASETRLAISVHKDMIASTLQVTENLITEAKKIINYAPDNFPSLTSAGFFAEKKAPVKPNTNKKPVRKRPRK